MTASDILILVLVACIGGFFGAASFDYLMDAVSKFIDDEEDKKDRYDPY
jgi:hypothetical protein